MFGGIDHGDNIVRSVEKYSPLTNTWEHITNMMDNRKFFSSCSFIDNVYLMGGYFDSSILIGDETAMISKFDILVCGGENVYPFRVFNDVKFLNAKNLSKVSKFTKNG